MPRQEFMTLIEAAAAIRRPYHATLRLVLVGELEGERRDGRWFVRRAAVERRLHTAPVVAA